MNDYQQGYRDAMIDVANLAQKKSHTSAGTPAGLGFWKGLNDLQFAIQLLLKQPIPEKTKNQELR